MNRSHIALAAVAFFAISNRAHANDFMFGSSSVFVVGPAALLWLLSGALIYIKRRELIFVGPGTIFVLLGSLAFWGHLEFALMFWMIYLALLFVYSAFPRKGFPKKARILNFVFHGTFLAIVIVGGIVAKAIYWSRQGSFVAWTNWMKEIYLGFLVLFGVVFVLVMTRFYFGVLKRAPVADSPPISAESQETH